MNSWCESCARKGCCYTMEMRPRCYIATTNTASGTPESYLAKSLRYSRDSHEIAKTEPSNSEKPNNCEDLQDWKDQMWAEAIEDEPTTEDCSTVDKDINVRSKDEPQTCSFSDCDNFKNPDYARCIECKRKQIELKTEPNSSEIPTGSTTEDCSVVEERSSE